MFTGIITDVGRIAAIERHGDIRFLVETSFDTSTIAIGASIAPNGCCLTVIEKQPGRYSIGASSATIATTTHCDSHAGALVHLEPTLILGDNPGSHRLVAHVESLLHRLHRRPNTLTDP